MAKEPRYVNNSLSFWTLDKKTHIMRYIIIVITMFLFIGCVSQRKYDKAISTIDSLMTENARLSQINEELENGEARLAGLYSQFVNQGKYIEAEEIHSKAIAKHPQAASNVSFRNISEVRKKAQAQRDSIEKAVRDSLFLANIDDLGEWRIGNYVNDFKEPTGEHYVYQYILGTFSNSATAGSRLGVVITINKSSSSPSKIAYSIEFDEYNDGTKDDNRLSNTKVVCPERRKVFVNQYYSLEFYDREEGFDSKNKYSFLDLLRMEDVFDVTDTHREYSLSTVYKFTINSHNLNNALVKAGILSVNDVLKQ